MVKKIVILTLAILLIAGSVMASSNLWANNSVVILPKSNEKLESEDFDCKEDSFAGTDADEPETCRYCGNPFYGSVCTDCHSYCETHREWYLFDCSQCYEENGPIEIVP